MGVFLWIVSSTENFRLQGMPAFSSEKQVKYCEQPVSLNAEICGMLTAKVVERKACRVQDQCQFLQ